MVSTGRFLDVATPVLTYVSFLPARQYYDLWHQGLRRTGDFFRKALQWKRGGYICTGGGDPHDGWWVLAFQRRWCKSGVSSRTMGTGQSSVQRLCQGVVAV